MLLFFFHSLVFSDGGALKPSLTKVPSIIIINTEIFIQSWKYIFPTKFWETQLGCYFLNTKALSLCVCSLQLHEIIGKLDAGRQTCELKKFVIGPSPLKNHLIKTKILSASPPLVK